MVGMEDSIRLKTEITIYNKTKGRVEYRTENLITTLGKELYADRLINDSITAIDYFAVGDDSTTHDATSTALNNEVFRKQLSTKSSPGNIAQYNVTVLGSEAVFVWREIGLFNDPTTGTMTNVANINYNHAAGDEVSIEWKVTLA